MTGCNLRDKRMRVSTMRGTAGKSVDLAKWSDKYFKKPPNTSVAGLTGGREHDAVIIIKVGRDLSFAVRAGTSPNPSADSFFCKARGTPRRRTRAGQADWRGGRGARAGGLQVGTSTGGSRTKIGVQGPGHRLPCFGSARANTRRRFGVLHGYQKKLNNTEQSFANNVVSGNGQTRRAKTLHMGTCARFLNAGCVIHVNTTQRHRHNFIKQLVLHQKLHPHKSPQLTPWLPTPLHSSTLPRRTRMR